MKRNYLVNSFALCLFLLPLFSQAQLGNESSVPYFRYALSGGVGPAVIYGDLQERKLGAGVFLRGDYFLRHGLSIGVEAQEGVLRSGGPGDHIGAYPVTLLFFTGLVNARFHPLQFIQNDHDRRIMYRKTYLKRAANTVYVGAGFGGILNFTRSDAVQTYTNGHRLGYLYHTDIGIDLPLSKSVPYLMDSFFWYLNINGQLNFSSEPGMDGFADKQDRYGLFTVGVKLKL